MGGTETAEVDRRECRGADGAAGTGPLGAGEAARTGEDDTTQGSNAGFAGDEIAADQSGSNEGCSGNLHGLHDTHIRPPVGRPPVSLGPPPRAPASGNDLSPSEWPGWPVAVNDTVGSVVRMWSRRFVGVVGAALLLAACSQTTPSAADDASDVTATTEAASTTSESSPSTTSAPTTTTTAPGPDVFDPTCVVQVRSGDSLGAIVSNRSDELVTVASVKAENGLTDDLIVPDQLLDVCIDNGLDDITGEQRLERNAAILATEASVSVIAQQTKLNALLTPYGFPEMPIDGVSGSVTRRGLCVSRLALGLPVNRADMAPGSPEEGLLLATEVFPIPPDVATDGRWIFIDLTCQVMLMGDGPGQLVHVFPTSTGEVGHETRLQERTRAFRFDPALDNGGWHDSTDYPVPADNALNGNMYKPLYFDNGQAIHGANSVPTSPQSKGCTRLRPPDQDAMLAWLGLDAVGGPVGGKTIDATVTIRGDYDLG